MQPNRGMQIDSAAEGTLQSPFGRVRLRFTERGLCALEFPAAAPRGAAIDPALADCFREWLSRFERLKRASKWRALDLEGTDFQRAVWRELLNIPRGGTTSYGAIAAAVGRPRAFRAVGSAVGANPVAVLVPCHRVLPAGGGTGNYRWGSERKRALLDAEQESGSDLEFFFQ